MSTSASGESRTTESDTTELDRQRAVLAAVEMAVRRYGVSPASAADEHRADVRGG